MLHSYQFIWATSLIYLAGCSPVIQSRSPSSLRPRQAEDCRGLQSIPNSACWDTLNITQYLNDSTTGWAKTTPTCQPGAEDSNCCHQGEAWSTCFLRLAGGPAGADCTAVDQGLCQGTAVFANLAPSIRAQVRYVLIGILKIHDLFMTWDLTLRVSRDLARQTQTSLSTALNYTGPPPDQSIVNDTLTMGPSFLYTFAETEGPSDAYGASQNLTYSLEQAPAVSKALWPNTTSLRNASTSALLNAGLDLIMRDVPTFVAFASGGQYAAAQPPVFDTSDNNAVLVSAAQTYSTSATLKQGGWYAVIGGPSSSSSTALRNYGYVNLTQGSRAYTNSSGAALYESSVTENIYSFQHRGKSTLSPIQLVNEIDSQGWAALEVLFDGSFNCTSQGPPEPGLVGVARDGTLDFGCLSSLPIFLGCGQACPTGRRVGGKCPFAYEYAKGC